MATSNGRTDEKHPEERDERKEGQRWKRMWLHIRDGQLVYSFNEKVRANDSDLRITSRSPLKKL